MFLTHVLLISSFSTILSEFFLWSVSFLHKIGIYLNEIPVMAHVSFLRIYLIRLHLSVCKFTAIFSKHKLPATMLTQWFYLCLYTDTLVYTLEATVDGEPSNTVSYSIANTETLRVDELSGDVRLNRLLDYEV